MLLWNLLLLLPSLSEVSLRSSPPSLPPSLFPSGQRWPYGTREGERRGNNLLFRETQVVRSFYEVEERIGKRGRLLLLLPPLSWEGREVNSPPQLSFLPHCASSGRERERREERGRRRRLPSLTSSSLVWSIPLCHPFLSLRLPPPSSSPGRRRGEKRGEEEEVRLLLLSPPPLPRVRLSRIECRGGEGEGGLYSSHDKLWRRRRRRRYKVGE